MNKAAVQKSFWRQAGEVVFLLILVFLIRTFGFGLYQVPSGSMETTLLVGERFFSDKFTYLFTDPKHGDIIACNEPLYPYSDNYWVNLFQRYVWGPQNWTKRVIAIPGDTIKGVIEDGHPVVYLNGKKLDEPYVNKYPLVPVELNEWRSYDPSLPYDQQKLYKMDGYQVQKNQRFFAAIGQPTIFMPGTPMANNADVFEITLGPDQYWVMGDNRLGSKDSRAWGALERKLIHGRLIWRIFSLDSTSSWWIFDLLLHPINFWHSVRWDRCFQRVS